MAALIVAVPLADLGISNLAACIALAVPLAVTVGEIAGLRPSVDGLIVTIAADEITPYHLTRGTAGLTLTSNTQEGGSPCG